jgi:hypothetical protein
MQTKNPAMRRVFLACRMTAFEPEAAVYLRIKSAFQ